MVRESKQCSRCEEVKPLNYFCRNNRSPDGYYSICDACRCNRSKQYTEEHKAKTKEKAKLYYKKNREAKLAYAAEYRKQKMAEDPNWKKLKEMAYKVGKTFEEVESWFNKQWMKQQAQCAICGKVFCDDDCIDHNHETNELRGLLCNLCNVGIGALKDSPAICLKANEYLIETERI